MVFIVLATNNPVYVFKQILTTVTQRILNTTPNEFPGEDVSSILQNTDSLRFN